MQQRGAMTAVVRAGAMLASAWAVLRGIEDLTTVRTQIDQWGVATSIVPVTLACSAARFVVPVVSFVTIPRLAARSVGATEPADASFWARLATTVAGLWLLTLGTSGLVWSVLVSLTDPYGGEDGLLVFSSIDGPSPWDHVAWITRVVVGAALVIGVGGLRRAGVIAPPGPDLDPAPG